MTSGTVAGHHNGHRTGAAILGSGNIGTDLLIKMLRSGKLQPRLFAGIDATSEGLRRAASLDVPTSLDGIGGILSLRPLPAIVFEATSAAVHMQNAPLYASAGIRVIDLTPAQIGTPVVPAVNLDRAFGSMNINMTSCGGQATVPIVAAISRAAPVDYAEIVSTIASRSAGPGTRQNIDEFTRTTAGALESIGGSERGKAIIVLNPAEPPIVMRNSVFCIVAGPVDEAAIERSVQAMTEEVRRYVQGYRLTAGPEFDRLSDGRVKVAVFTEVKGAADFLPAYAGNLDIMTAAALAVGEELADRASSDPSPR